MKPAHEALIVGKPALSLFGVTIIDVNSAEETIDGITHLIQTACGLATCICKRLHLVVAEVCSLDLLYEGPHRLSKAFASSPLINPFLQVRIEAAFLS